MIGEQDIRGWYVYGGQGERIGQVKELLCDALARKVRYLVLNLEVCLQVNVDNLNKDTTRTRLDSDRTTNLNNGRGRLDLDNDQSTRI